tara:strand:+ start:1483 stop:3168 length:1686 start_codon:yes stop_codon:yes gene_type:complete
MASLTGQSIASSYEQLLHVDTNGGGSTTTLLPIKDGDNGTTFALAISTTAISLNATNRIYLDGTSGHTYIDEESDNLLRIAVGAAEVMKLDADSRVSLSNNDSGTNNTLLGKYSGLSILSGGNHNTFLGERAGYEHKLGEGNIAIGSGAFDASYVNDTTDAGNDNNVFIGRNAGSGTWVAAGSDVAHANHDNIGIGTSALAGAMTGSEGNIGIGTDAGKSITSAPGCIFIGYNAGNQETTGNRNTVLGYGAMDQSGDANSSDAGMASHDNVFIGHDSGGGNWTHNPSGNNVAIGAGTMEGAMNDANGNVAVGKGAGAGITTGDNNVLIGLQAGETIAAQGNCVCIGNLAGGDINNSGANGSVAIGHSALSAATQGAGNTAVGFQAGNVLTTGGTNTIIGYDADVDANSRAGCIIIGSSLSLNTASDNVVEIGNDTNSMTYDLDGGDITVTSDVRTKKDIKDTKLGLEFINMLRPITYKTKPSSEYPEEFNIKQPSKKSSNKVWDGLIAQEVKAVIDELGVDFSGWEEGINTKQRLAYGKFVMPLIKAVQELSAQVEELKNK